MGFVRVGKVLIGVAKVLMLFGRVCKVLIGFGSVGKVLFVW